MHAFFKGLLFLGSGSVIHGVEHGFHHAHAHGNGHGAHDDHGHHGPTVLHRRDGDLNPEDPQDMRNMGGLLKRMPITGWTFILGGLSLCGFPLLTAGFWSKDEILASAWYTSHIGVLVTLAIAAFLTAFYTTRQMSLTFLGQPRTAGAEHAPESVKSMTIPLILITPFALFLGWIGIPNYFPVIGGLVPNAIEGFLEPYIEALNFHVAHPEGSLVPLAISLVVALGGIALGWLVYGRRAYAYETVDPLRRWLGPIWWLLHRKYYVDEFYQYTFIPLTRGVSKFLYWFDDLWVIDPIVDGIGKLGVWLSKVAANFDRYIVDGLVNAFGPVMGAMGGLLRNTQDGRVQVYLLVLVISVTVWLLLKALPAILTLV
jgi:NADH-quinone oxidoreductase subunit L